MKFLDEDFLFTKILNISYECDLNMCLVEKLE